MGDEGLRLAFGDGVDDPDGREGRRVAVDEGGPGRIDVPGAGGGPDLPGEEADKGPGKGGLLPRLPGLPVEGPIPEIMEKAVFLGGEVKPEFTFFVEPGGEGLGPGGGFPEGVEAVGIGDVAGDSPVKVRPEEVEDREGEVIGTGAVADPDA
jgi:hypothetical protein